MAIDLSAHLTDLKGKPYLPVAPRIAAFREQHPLWSVVTDVTIVNGEPRMVRATVTDDAGHVLATAHKTVTAFAGGAVEKAETGAIGRALSLIGIGTLQALDFDEGDEIADAPVTPPRLPARVPSVTPAKRDARDIPPTPAELADIAGMSIDDLRVAYSAAKGAGRAQLAEQIKGMADSLLAKANEHAADAA